MHADKAYVFTTSTNGLHRIVAIGNVVLTNEARRAYADRMSYYRADGMVVLYGKDGRAAEVREEAKDGDRVVKGEKIKFWIDSEQVEIIKSDITAPSSGMQGGIKSVL
jgi:lipopolysaccharide export system protein LptA